MTTLQKSEFGAKNCAKMLITLYNTFRGYDNCTNMPEAAYKYALRWKQDMWLWIVLNLLKEEAARFNIASLKYMTLHQFAQVILKARERFLAILRFLEKEQQKEILDDAFGMIFTGEMTYRYKGETFFLFCVIFLSWMKSLPEEQQYLQLDEYQKQSLKAFTLDFDKLLEYGVVTFL